MLEVLKSKSMIGFVILILGISFIGTNNNQSFDDNYNNEITLNN